MTARAADIVAAYTPLFPGASWRSADLPAPVLSPNLGPHALILPPHPDDECLMGLLPLRLMRESSWRVSVAAITHGSAPERQAARQAELADACKTAGFSLVSTPASGIADAPALAKIIARERPDLLVIPHAEDWHPAHIRTHRIALDALALIGAAEPRPLFVVETEYWRPMREPNLLVAASADDMTTLLAALMRHTGEVARNPYHLTYPAWLLDSVRRGAEWIGGRGAFAPDFAFGELYRLSRWQDGKLVGCETQIMRLTMPATLEYAKVTNVA